MTPILAPVIVALVVILTLLLLLLMGYLLWLQYQAAAESERRNVQRKLRKDRPARARMPRTTQAAICTMGPSRIPVDGAGVSRNCFKVCGASSTRAAAKAKGSGGF